MVTLASGGREPNRKMITVSNESIDNLGLRSAGHFQNSSKSLLEAVRASDVGMFGEQLNGLVLEAKKMDPKTLANPGIIKRVTNIFKSGKERMLSEYQSVQERMDSLIEELDKSSNLHIQRVKDLEKMSQENLVVHQELDQSVAEGKSLLNQLNSKLELLKQDTENFEAQREVSLVIDQIDRLEKRIDDLQRSMLLAKQAEPQIRMLQNNARVLYGKFQDIKNTTIPAWRSALTMFILQQEQKKSTDLVNLVTDATESAMINQSKMFREGAASTAKLSQRSSVSIQVLEEVQKNLLGAFDDVAQITGDAKQNRLLAEKQVAELTNQLHDRFVRK